MMAETVAQRSYNTAYMALHNARGTNTRLKQWMVFDVVMQRQLKHEI